MTARGGPESDLPADPPGAESVALSPKPASATRNVAWSLAQRVGLIVLSIVSSPLIVHGFGEKRYGILSIGFTTVGFLAFLDLGLTAAAVRELAHAHARGDDAMGRRIYSTAVAVYLVLALLASTVLVLLAPTLVDGVFHIEAADRSDALFVIRAAGVGLGLNLALAPLTAVARAMQRFDISSIVSVAVTVAMTVGLMIAAHYDAIRAAVLVQLGSTVLGMVAYAAVNVRLAPHLRLWPAIDRVALRVLAGFAVFQMLGQVFGALSMHADRLIVAAVVSPADLTWYQVPAGLSQKIHVLVAAAAAFLFPRMAELSGRGDDLTRQQLYVRSVRLTMLFALLAGLPLIAGGEAFLQAWMGVSFAEHATVSLRLTAAANILFCFTVAPVYTLLGLGKPRTVALITFSTGALNVVLALWLVPAFGRDGAGLAMLLAMPVSIAAAGVVQRQLGGGLVALAGSMARLIPPALVAAGVTALVVGLVPLHLIAVLGAMAVGATAGLVAYLGVGPLGGEDGVLARAWLTRARQMWARRREGGRR